MKKGKILAFSGFEPANTTPVPDILFDDLLSELSGSELKVLLYIIRRTKGFKKDTDAISLTQFQKGITTKEGKTLDKGCGIDDRQTIIKALNSLEDKKCIISEKSKTVNGDNAVTVYRIYFNQQVVGKSNQGSREIQPPQFEKPTTVVGNVNYGVVGKSNPQETVIQETVIQESKNVVPFPDNVDEENKTPPNNQSSLSTLDPDVERIWMFYSALFKRSKPKFQDKNLAQCKQLAPHVQTQEEMNSLAEHAKTVMVAQARKDTTVYLGNMVEPNILNSWKKPNEPIPFLKPASKSQYRNLSEKYRQEEQQERLAQGGN